jgi:hypothetical protein
MAFNQFPQKGGIPSGQDAARPSSPAIGDTYYNGQGGILEIYTSAGWQPCSAPSGIPIITVTDAASSRTYTDGPAVNVSFTASTNGGFPLGFTGIATSAVTSSVYTNSVLSPGNSTTIPTFSGSSGYGATYAITGTSYNGFGTSPYSPASTITVTTKPQAPTIGTATTNNTTSDVTVTWTNNANGGKVFTAIKINAYISGNLSTTQTAATTSSTSHAFTGLTAGTAYTFKVFAVNANGDGELSAATNSIAINDATIEYLVLAGGGGGSSIIGGGGGAGGLRTGTGYVKTGTAYTITIGAGGRGAFGYSGTASSEAGYPGWDSVLGSITASGGGGTIGWSGSGTPSFGGQRTWSKNGGCGGGATAQTGGSFSGAGTGNLGGYSPVEGYDGGPGDNDPQNGGLGGGGGGTASVGLISVSSNNQRSGGNGAASSISGSSINYGGGGGAGRRTSVSSGPSLGGSGGGGQSMTSGSFSSNQNGESARGGGGGGGNYSGPDQNSQAGGNGGSGTIVLKIPNTYTATFSGGVTQNPSMSTAVSGFKIYFITGAGTSDTVTIS